MDNQKLNLLSIGEASEYLGVSIDTLRRWEKKGKILSYRSPGGHRYFKQNELDDMFGRKYERAPEEKPRKEYQTKGIESESPAAAIKELEDDQIQDEVDTILSDSKKIEEEIEIFFDRQPKNIEIPKLNPIKVKQTETLAEGITGSQVQLQTISQSGSIEQPNPPQPKLINSFSQLSGGDQYKKSKSIKGNYVLILVAAVVVVTALVFTIVYLTTRPTLISPI